MGRVDGPGAGWHTADWDAFRTKHLGSECSVCGSTGNLYLHHLRRGDYYNPDNVVTVCKGCHFLMGKGLVKCKLCGEKWHPRRYRSCWGCAHGGDDDTAESVRAAMAEMEDEGEEFE